MALRGWRPGTRVERLRASHTYGYVLLLVGLTYVFIVAAPNQSWVRGVLILIETGTLATALWTSGLGWIRATLPLAALAVSVAIVQFFVGGSTMRGLDSILDVLLIAATVVVIGVGVLDQGEINRKSVTGAVCVYLILGILFTFAYSAAAEFGTGPFFAQGSDGTPADRIYFSYVTLATLGYGDYTAAGQPGRSFAIAESLLGQLYLVTVVALLVGRFGQPARKRA
jgi:Ion channel